MSLSTSTEPLSSANESNLEDKNMISLNSTLVKQYQVIPFDLRQKTAEKTENYDQKNGTQI